MKLSTIWSLRYMTLTERLIRTRDWGAMAVAARLPKRIRYWTTILEVAKATQDSPNIPATPLDSILKKLDAPKVTR